MTDLDIGYVDDFPTDDEPVSTPAFAPTNGKRARGICRVCGEPAYMGRATYCEEHKPDPTDSAPKGTRGGRKTNLEAQLLATMQPLGMLFQIRHGMSHPHEEINCGAAAAAQIPELCKALADQAKQSKRLEKALTLVSAPGGWLSVAAAVTPFAFVFYQNHMAAPQQVEQPPMSTEFPPGFEPVS